MRTLPLKPCECPSLPPCYVSLLIARLWWYCHTPAPATSFHIFRDSRRPFHTGLPKSTGDGRSSMRLLQCIIVAQRPLSPRSTFSGEPRASPRVSSRRAAQPLLRGPCRGGREPSVWVQFLVRFERFNTQQGWRFRPLLHNGKRIGGSTPSSPALRSRATVGKLR